MNTEQLKQRAKDLLAKLEHGAYRVPTSSRDYQAARALANMGLVELTARAATRSGHVSYLVSKS